MSSSSSLTTTSKKRRRSVVDTTQPEKRERKEHWRHQRAREKREKNEPNRQQTRQVIRRLIQVGSVLDPLAKELLEAKEKKQVAEVIGDLMTAVQMSGLECVVDPLDAFVAVAEIYTEEAGPIERDITEALMQQVPEMARWPPGLLPMVVGFVAGGRNEAEWNTVKKEYVASLDAVETRGVRGNNKQKEWKRIMKCIYEHVEGIKDHGWRVENAQTTFHPLTLMAVWSLTHEQFSIDIGRLVKCCVRRHVEMIKAMAILFHLVQGIYYLRRDGYSFLQLLILQSHHVGIHGPISLKSIAFDVFDMEHIRKPLHLLTDYLL